MKLKSSNKSSILFIAITAIIIVLLFSFGSKKKESKYPETPKFEQKTVLNLIQISLNEKYYDKLKKKRNKALSIGVLVTSTDDYVPATITFDSIDYRAEIRLKGDWTDHLKGDKWSFRIKLKDDKTILGMRKFSIHHPRTRGYVNEWLYHKAIKKEGLIGLRYGFLEGVIHIKSESSSEFINKEVGIYAIEETFDKRTIESNQRKESVILKFSENLWWDGVKKSIAVGAPSGLHWNNFNKSVEYPITVFSESKVLQDDIMLNYFKTAKNLLNNLGKEITLSEAFDIKKLAMQNAILNLFGGVHGNYKINLRFYYNPITSILEPIAFDANSGVKLKKYEHFIFARGEKKDSLYLNELTNAMDKVSKPEYLKHLIKEYKEQISTYEKVLKNEFGVSGFSFQNIEYNQGIIREELTSINQGKETNITALKRIEIPNFSKWANNEISFKQAATNLNVDRVYTIARNSNIKPSYSVIPNIRVNYGRTYSVSLIAKKGILGNHMGLRIQGIYPNRVDAVFDLEKGNVKGFENAGGFENASVLITPLGKGWFKCSISAQTFAEDVRVVFGPTSDYRSIGVWEASTKEKLDLLVVPSSMIVEELLN